MSLPGALRSNFRHDSFSTFNFLENKINMKFKNIIFHAVILSGGIGTYVKLWWLQLLASNPVLDCLKTNSLHILCTRVTLLTQYFANFPPQSGVHWAFCLVAFIFCICARWFDIPEVIHVGFFLSVILDVPACSLRHHQETPQPLHYGQWATCMGSCQSIYSKNIFSFFYSLSDIEYFPIDPAGLPTDSS